MNIPGFAAEASLYRTDERYQMTGRLSQEPDSIRPSDCFSDCISNCFRLHIDPHFPGYLCLESCQSQCGGL